MTEIRNFYQRNKKWIDELAQNGDILSRAMALVIKKNANVDRKTKPDKIKN